jgi:hypothetical protein
MGAGGNTFHLSLDRDVSAKNEALVDPTTPARGCEPGLTPAPTFPDPAF